MENNIFTSSSFQARSENNTNTASAAPNISIFLFQTVKKHLFDIFILHV